jgi:hypothetical protein
VQNTLLKFITGILFSLIPVISVSQQPDYRGIFGTDWVKAEEYLIQNFSWMDSTFKKHNISYAEVVAVIFPELIRYSALRDKMETAFLKTLYRNLGAEYANFSIGHFQIKPVFAEEIREISLTIPSRRERTLFREKSSFDNERLYRADIIADLEDPRREILYVLVFIKACNKIYGKLPTVEADRIAFLATAYNAGMGRSRNEIEGLQGSKYFTTRIAGGEKYNYSDISLQWYRDYIDNGGVVE